MLSQTVYDGTQRLDKPMDSNNGLFQILTGIAEIEYKPLGLKGEDALTYNFQRNDLHTLAVFDGCGGAGSWKYPEFDNATGAFISAQIISRIYARWFSSLSADETKSAENLAVAFHDESFKILTQLKSNVSPMGVAGTLVKSFPCTASIAIIGKHPEMDDSLYLTALNCGDSRVYYLTPGSGLVQLTTDDSRGHPDPLKSLRVSAALSEMLNADKPYTIKSRKLLIHIPFAVITASDGVFGYVRSPMDFEWMVLECLITTDSFVGFENAFKEKIVEITGDDSTCLIAFYGWESFEDIKKDFKQRYETIRSLVEILDNEVEEKKEALLERIWNIYKKQTVYDEMDL